MLKTHHTRPCERNQTVALRILDWIVLVNASSGRPSGQNFDQLGRGTAAQRIAIDASGSRSRPASSTAAPLRDRPRARSTHRRCNRRPNTMPCRIVRITTTRNERQLDLHRHEIAREVVVADVAQVFGVKVLITPRRINQHTASDALASTPAASSSAASPSPAASGRRSLLHRRYGSHRKDLWPGRVTAERMWARAMT